MVSNGLLEEASEELTEAGGHDAELLLLLPLPFFKFSRFLDHVISKLECMAFFFLEGCSA